MMIKLRDRIISESKKTYTYTHISIKGLTRRQVCNKMLKALNVLTNTDNGTMNNPYEIASTVLDNDKTLIQTLKDEGKVNYSDGIHRIECDDEVLYVDYTDRAIKEIMQGYTRLANDDFEIED